MNPAQLLAHFERIGEAPDAVPRLRRFILDLAVRGRLVPQDPKDEAAANLLNLIRSKRSDLVKKGKCKPPKAVAALSAKDILFELPSVWTWAFANDLWDFENGDRSKNYPSRDQFVPSGVPFVNAGHLVNGKIHMPEMNFISEAKFADLRSGKLRNGDQVYCLRGSLGKHALYDHDREAAIASSLVILRPVEPRCVSYLSIYLDSDIAKTMLRRFDNGSAQPNLSSADLRLYEIPLPPLAEQHRIVDRVDELMALCDQLEAARGGRETRRDRLAASSFAGLNTPDPGSFKDDANFALDVLPAVTTRPDQIRQLRQTILNLAVRGMLVPQDPKDEPASKLLKTIAIEIPNTKLVEGWSEPPPFEVPGCWTWIRLGRLVSQSCAGWSPKTEDRPRTNDEWGVLKVSAVSWDKFRAWENKQVLPGTEPRLQAQVKHGDFLISRANTAELIARAVIVEEEPLNLMMSDKIVRLQLSKSCDHRFVWIVNNYADFAREHYARHASGVSPSMKNVSRDVILNLPYPLPPLAEQRRIVTKVDELLVLCDRLEASLRSGVERRSGLLAAVLNEALQPAVERDEAA